MPYTKSQRRLIRKFSKLGPRAYARDHLAERAELAQRIRERQTNGEILTVHGGTDCDGYTYGPHYGYLPAYAMAVEHAQHRRFDGADGPCYLRVATPGEIEAYYDMLNEMEAA